MSKRKVLLVAVLFALLMMVFALTAFAADETVRIKVKTFTGVKTVEVAVSDLFEMTVKDNKYQITGIKASFGSYAASSVTELRIPGATSTLSLTSTYAAVDTIIFEDGTSGLTVNSLTGLTNLKTLRTGASSNITFGSSCVSSTVTTLDFYGKKANITFNASSFKDRINVTTLNFATDSTYTLGANCFQGLGIKSLTLTDGAKFTFNGAGAFYGCLSLKELYAGNGATDFKNSPFDYCGSLETAYLTAVTNISDNAFRVPTSGNGAAKCALKVYNHATSQVTIGSNAFTGRSAYGVVVCAAATNVTSFSNCKYELHYGIQHKYFPANSEPTCYTSYTTDCPCGYVRNAYYKLYKSGASMQIVELISGVNPDVPHTYTGAKSVKFENGICQSGLVERQCTVCNTAEGFERVAPALAVFAGYSVPETGAAAITAGIRYNSVSIQQYEAATGEEIDFGMVLAAKKGLGANSPLTATGEVYSSSVYKLDMSSLGMFESNLKLTRLSSAAITAEFIFAGYIKIGTEIYYIQGGEVTDMPQGVTYTSLIK